MDPRKLGTWWWGRLNGLAWSCSCKRIVIWWASWEITRARNVINFLPVNEEKIASITACSLLCIFVSLTSRRQENTRPLHFLPERNFCQTRRYNQITPPRSVDVVGEGTVIPYLFQLPLPAADAIGDERSNLTVADCSIKRDSKERNRCYPPQ